MARQVLADLPLEARRLLARSVRLCDRMVEQRDTQAEERRQLWAELHAAGVTRRLIAEQCHVSEQLVALELAKVRGASWVEASRSTGFSTARTGKSGSVLVVRTGGARHDATPGLRGRA